MEYVLVIQLTLTISNKNKAMYNKKSINENTTFNNGMLIGFSIATIVWCLFWSLLINRINNTHKQEINCLIEKHMNDNP
jgi:hypothetical protein